jgi:3-hydroxyisobutyrate dehydrogenase
MVCHTNFLALSEGCAMAERAGLGLQAVIDVINAGNARSYISQARFPNHILSGSFDGRSRVSNLAKDLGMAEELACQLGQESPYTSLTTALLDQAVSIGRQDDDFTTLYPAYAALAGGLAR